MDFLVGFFFVAFALLFLFMGVGVLVLGYFDLAPRPAWMKQYFDGGATRGRAPVGEAALGNIAWLKPSTRSLAPGIVGWAAGPRVVAGISISVATSVIGIVANNSQFPIVVDNVRTAGFAMSVGAANYERIVSVT